MSTSAPRCFLVEVDRLLAAAVEEQIGCDWHGNFLSDTVGGLRLRSRDGLGARRARYSPSRDKVCTAPLSAPYSLITRSRSAADGNSARIVSRGLAVKLLERHGGAELHRLDIVAAAVVIDKPFGLHDFVEGDAVLIVAAVGAVHDEAPDAARPQRRRRWSWCESRPGPTIAPDAWDRSTPSTPGRAARRTRACTMIVRGSCSRSRLLLAATSLLLGLQFLADKPPDGRSVRPRGGDIPRASRRRP